MNLKSSVITGRGLAITAGFLVAVFLILQVSPIINPVTEDESTSVCDAQRIVWGQVPYRDFFSLWAPVGGYVLSGWPMGWGERPETAARYIQVLVLLLGTFLVAVRLRKNSSWGVLPAVVIPVVLFPMAIFNGNHWLAIMFYIGAILLADKLSTGKGAALHWFFLGFIVATAGCTMQTEGILGIVLVLFTILTSSRKLKESGAKIAIVGAGALSACCLWIGPLLIKGAGSAFLKDVILWPLINYRKPGNIVDLPFLADLPFRIQDLWTHKAGESLLYFCSIGLAGTLLYLFVIISFFAVSALSIYHLAGVLLRRKPIDRQLTTTSVLTLTALGLYAHINPTWVHFVYAFTPVLVLWAIILTSRNTNIPSKVWIPAFAIIVVAGCLFNCRDYLGQRHYLWEYLNVDRVDRESPLNRSLRSLPFMEKGDTVAVLPAGSKVYLYAFPPAVGYTQLFTLDEGHYDLNDHQQVAREIAERLPKLVLLDKINEKGFLSKEDPISSVLKTHYSMWSQSPSVSVYARKDLLNRLMKSAGNLGETR